MKKGRSTSLWAALLSIPVIVGALGYFVDIFDLILFSVVRVPSLKDIGVPDAQILSVGVHLLNLQMIGMLLGGILWGIIGDKHGRLSVLFGSIFLYSIANVLNGFVHTAEAYAVLRFISGFGLAGELGAAITLVSEILHKDHRGYGTTIMAALGVCGGLLASTVADLLSWRTAYFVGGGMGLALLVLRITMTESGMFDSVKQDATVARGNFFALFYPMARFKRYLSCILIGVPIWFVIGILITFSPELSRALGVQGEIHAGHAVFCSYLGTAVGGLLSGFLSQWIHSRRKAVFIFLVLTLGFVLLYLFSYGIGTTAFYALCVAVGFASGYWTVFATVAAEQFGTNLRATVAITVPNFVRGAVVPITLTFQALQRPLGIVQAALWVGLTTLALAFGALVTLQETYGKDLMFTE